MKERPILFNAENVQAILDGRKTMTRRVMKPQPNDYGLIPFTETMAIRWKGNLVKLRDMPQFCPYSQVGDRLWCKEAYNLNVLAGVGDKEQFILNYRAGGTSSWFKINEVNPKPPFRFQKWTPSIFMPRWASRLTLEITGLRAERLQDITEDDAKAEGVTPHRIDWDDNISPNVTIDYREGFIKLWNSINAKRGYSWEKNPWVWVIEFKVSK